MKPPPIPTKYRKPRAVRHWGEDCTVTPAVCEAHHGDGRLLLMFVPLSTRPNYYLIRVDSAFFDAEYDNIDDVIELLIEEFGEKESERDCLAKRLGWPVLSLDSGCVWDKVADLGKRAKR